MTWPRTPLVQQDAEGDGGSDGALPQRPGFGDAEVEGVERGGHRLDADRGAAASQDAADAELAGIRGFMCAEGRIPGASLTIGHAPHHSAHGR
jgi:hypothetical protein